MASRKLPIKFSCVAALCIGTMALAGCGGGGGSDSAAATTTTTTTTTLAVSSIQLPTQVQVVSSK